MNKRFLKRNWKNILIFVLVILVVISGIYNTKLASVHDTKRQAVALAGLDEDDTSSTETPEIGGKNDISRYLQGIGATESRTESADTQSAGLESKNSDSSKNRTESRNTGTNKADQSKGDQEKEDKTGLYQWSYQEDVVSANRVSLSEARQSSDGNYAVVDSQGNVTGYVENGKPVPIDESDQVIDKNKSFHVYLSIDCDTILNHMDSLDKGLDKYVGDGTILPKTEVVCYDGETVWDVLNRECKARGIQLESSHTAKYGSVYVEGINNLYEFSCGDLSGWCYSVDGWFPNYGCSRYVLKEGEYIRWRYTCDLGADIGIEWLGE